MSSGSGSGLPFMTRIITDSAFVVVTSSPPQSARTIDAGAFVTAGLPDASLPRERLDIDRDAPDPRRLPVIG
ncbi:hypothetical protein AB0H42_14960 [Nocardia sp. NPDC050799]|uniref:hypothetical protein n=1 Tax=Nocardia sp. NPDC050799 TaxID=3154842 RepID=UPI0033FBCA1B